MELTEVVPGMFVDAAEVIAVTVLVGDGLNPRVLIMFRDQGSIRVPLDVLPDETETVDPRERAERVAVMVAERLGNIKR